MAYDPGDLRLSLAAAVGDDPALVADLRAAFRQSIAAHADALARARTAADWRAAAWRLQGVAASFGVTALLQAAQAAAERPCGDSEALRLVAEAMTELAG